MSICRDTVLAERLRRHRLTDPLRTPDGYLDLFRALQPVSPVASSRPGDPPRLRPRTLFDDGIQADRMRARREMVKGRFRGGKIGYVLAADLALYANAFRKPMDILSDRQRIVLEAVQDVGPLTPRQIKAETQLLNKAIMPALHRLQTAFLVYEDQTDDDWERSWYGFGAEWPEVELDPGLWEHAATTVLLRFLRGHVFATFEQLKDWSQYAKRSLVRLVGDAESRGMVVPARIEGLGEGWMCPEDASLPDREHGSAVFVLHKADPLVQSHSSELKRRFGGQEVLQYLLIDGAFRGAVLGHWRISPHPVADIAVALPAAERARRKEDIVAVVARQYHPPHSAILAYDGQAL